MTSQEINETELSPPKPTSAEAGSANRTYKAVAFLFLLVVAAVISVAVYSGIRSRVAAETRLKTVTEEAAVPTVNVTHPKVGAASQELVLPGNTQAFIDAPIYARTNGYLKRWYFDIGAHVKQGQLLAEIETPEVDQQLQQAKADLQTAKANLDLSRITAQRMDSLVKSGTISQQSADQASGDLNAKQATYDSGAANVRRLEQLQSFEKVYSPFDGVITARNTDVGALIDAGAGAQGKELFHLVSTSKLRVFVNVPEVYSREARAGSTVTLTLDEFPGRVFSGTLVRNSNSIDAASRTLLIEVDVNNPSGELLPGAYVSVHLKLQQEVRSVTIPADTLLFRSEGPQVAVVKTGKAVLVPVIIG
ncbi:MAG TPA: efflux RND transporter periplasmic adaptor subunit, partial [Blastocatellia bacterium]|nr:efflux RND transporter periplasmic adaptor subunit [Blastocatellia bacterium]